MNTTAKARTANDVANLFFAQKLADEKSRVERWQGEFTEALSEGNTSAAGFRALWLYDTCVVGKIDSIISHNQGAWLWKMLAREERWHKRTPRTVIYEGRDLGTWSYCEPGYGDPYDRMTFRVKNMHTKGCVLIVRAHIWTKNSL